jgi:hypothetical protein
MILGRTEEGLIKIKTDDPLGLRAVSCACCGDNPCAFFVGPAFFAPEYGGSLTIDDLPNELSVTVTLPIGYNEDTDETIYGPVDLVLPKIGEYEDEDYIWYRLMVPDVGPIKVWWDYTGAIRLKIIDSSDFIFYAGLYEGDFTSVPAKFVVNNPFNNTYFVNGVAVTRITESCSYTDCSPNIQDILTVTSPIKKPIWRGDNIQLEWDGYGSFIYDAYCFSLDKPYPVYSLAGSQKWAIRSGSEFYKKLGSQVNPIGTYEGGYVVT